MIKLGSAISCLKNTRAVGLESSCIDSNWNWLLLESCCHLGGASSNIMVWGYVGYTFAWVILAGWVISIVWVVTFSLEFLGFKILESVVHKSTVASLVSVWSWAINKLLFREWGKRVSSKFVGSFNWTCGGESPAWSALSLVLNTGNYSFSNPVNGRFEVVGGEVLLIANFVGVWSVSKIESLEFSRCEIRELVDAFEVADVISGVVKFNLFLNVEPILESVSVFLMWEVVFVVFVHPSHEFLFIFGDNARFLWELSTGLSFSETEVAHDSDNGN